MDFLQGQLPRALAHGVGAYAGEMLGKKMLPSLASGTFGKYAIIAAGCYLGSVAYQKISSDGDLDWQVKTDTVAAAIGATAGCLYADDTPVSIIGGAIAGDLVGSYFGY